jgi:sugar lactone lactonase YvrE
VAVGPLGEVYIASPETGRVFSVGASGRLRIAAGHVDVNFRQIVLFNRGHGLPDPRTEPRDGRPALDTLLLAPTGVAVDARGNVFVSDAEEGRVYRIDAGTGMIATVAGSGVVEGDAGPAVKARLVRPTGLAWSSSGDLLIADPGDHRVRRVDMSGRITTVAGDGLPGDRGDGGPAYRARLSSPEGMAVDARGDVYIADRGNDRIRRVSAATGEISTVIGMGLRSPTAVSVERAGNLWVADHGNHRVTRFDLRGRVLTGGWNEPGADPYSIAVDTGTGLLVSDAERRVVFRVNHGRAEPVAGNGGVGYVGDGGPARSARLGYPQGLAVDAGGNVYVADSQQNRVRRIDAQTGIIRTVGGDGRAAFDGDGGPGRRAALNSPSGVCVDRSGVLYVADTGNNRIRKIADGIITTVAGDGVPSLGGDGGPAAAAHLRGPTGLAIGAEGDLYVVDAGNRSLRRIDRATGTITTVIASSLALASVTVGPAGELLVADNDRARILRVDGATGEYLPLAGNGVQGYDGDGRPATEASLGAHLGLAATARGEVLIADFKNRRVRRVDTAGVISTVAGNGEIGRPGPEGPALHSAVVPLAVAADPRGNIVFSDSWGYVFSVDADGTMVVIAGGGFGF